MHCHQETCIHFQPILFVYSDGGPDHRLTYLSVQVELISRFLKFDLDFLCVARTAPFHSWRNPVECVMPLLNLGLQSMGVMRKKMDEGYESAVANCNNMAQLRKVAEKNPNVKDDTLDSVLPVKIPISSVFQRLELTKLNLSQQPQLQILRTSG